MSRSGARSAAGGSPLLRAAEGSRFRCGRAAGWRRPRRLRAARSREEFRGRLGRADGRRSSSAAESPGLFSIYPRMRQRAGTYDHAKRAMQYQVRECAADHGVLVVVCAPLQPGHSNDERLHKCDGERV